MSDHLCACRRRIVLAQASHLFAAHLVDRGVVPDQIPSHDGCFGTPTAWWLCGTLPRLLGGKQWGHLAVEAHAPGLDHLGAGPGGLGEKATLCANVSGTDRHGSFVYEGEERQVAR